MSKRQSSASCAILLCTTSLVTALIFASHAHANGLAPWPPLPDHEIVKREIPCEDERLKKYFGDHFEHALKLEGAQDAIFLARSYGDQYGFARRSLELKWLAADFLLHVSWHTVSQGTGNYQMNSDLLLLKEGGEWSVLFRDTHHGYTGGIPEGTNVTLHFAYEPGSHTLVVRRVRYDRHWGAVSESGIRPLAIACNVGTEASNKDVICCRTEYALVKEWICTLKDGSVKWEPGVHMLDLGSEIFPTEEVAEFLQQHRRLNEERKLEPEELVRRIEALNPRLRGTGACWGQVRFREGLAPYAPDEGHYYRMGP